MASRALVRRTTTALVLVMVTLRLSAATGVIEGTRSTLGEWVKARQVASKERASWDADKELIMQTMALYERELKAVDEKMSVLDTNNVQVAKERAEAEQSLKRSNEALEQMAQFAGELEVAVTKLIPRLPVPLQEDEQFKKLADRLPASVTASTTNGVSSATNTVPITVRIQTLVGLLNEIDKFNNAVSIFSEKRKNAKGDEVSVDTVYVGLGAAYFVNDDNDFAGTGTVGPHGWEWATQSELGPSVREVIRIYRNERTARFVPLPVEIK